MSEGMRVEKSSRLVYKHPTVSLLTMRIGGKTGVFPDVRLRGFFCPCLMHVTNHARVQRPVDVIIELVKRTNPLNLIKLSQIKVMLLKLNSK